MAILRALLDAMASMDNSENNICKTALIVGQDTCAGEDLLNECIEWCNKLNTRCATMGTGPLPEKARSDNFKLKNALWPETIKNSERN